MVYYIPILRVNYENKDIKVSLLFRLTPKYLKTILLITTMVCISQGLSAQQCTLGVGGKDTEVIVQVFQLNEAQQEQMRLWIKDLKELNKPLEEKARVLFDTHPQNNSAEIAQLANKYKELKDEMVANSAAYDQKLISLFNPRQYERYIELCMEARRAPIRPLPKNTAETPEKNEN